MVTQIEIARRLGLDVSTVNKILNKRQGPVFRKDTIKRVFKAAKDLGYDFGRLKYQHHRRHHRHDVAISAEIAIYQKDGSVYDRGVATIRDISLCGARINDITLPRSTFPVEPFTVGLRPMQKPADDLELKGRVVRLHQKGSLGFGIDFMRPEPSAEKKLRKLAGV